MSLCRIAFAQTPSGTPIQSNNLAGASILDWCYWLVVS